MYFRNNDEVLDQDFNEIRSDFDENPMMDYYPDMYGPQMMPYDMMPGSMGYEDDDMYRSSHRSRRRRRRRRHHIFHHHFHRPMFPWWWFFFR
ncbi:hypothetical protein KQI86_08395 [Clostridium sp. MSJ-11]|uniref:Uncharacterized protein n=2 Tax=Clostridium mobile TaxID=2841512 RepID=A0ABS6EI31_9CLOT|nr:hypothetical protein [Clostridium mobile]